MEHTLYASKPYGIDPHTHTLTQPDMLVLLCHPGREQELYRQQQGLNEGRKDFLRHRHGIGQPEVALCLSSLQSKA